MDKSLENIVEECLEKWNKDVTRDERLSYFYDNFETWISQIPSKYHSVVLTLVQNLEYYSHKTTNQWLKELHRQLIERSNVTEDNTIYAFIKSKHGKTNSSNDYWTEYKLINRINKNTCIENMDLLEEEDFQYIDNIVFIDDFSGSGKSFIDELKKHPERYKSKAIYFVVINAMYKALEEIQKYAEENELEIVVLSAFKQEKAFERSLFENDDSAKNMIVEMSKDLQIPKNDRLGFDKSQALVAFYNNTPNNTLGFIRYDTEDYKSIFPRKDEYIPEWMRMRKERLKRKQTNYNNAKKGV